ncbi:MAG TPA: hypothetical protein VEW90_04105, partial [Gaiellaceae bacterium]|nr:hypothetical protein [Gaiellaceae bacterium]
VRTLAAEMERIHPNLYHAISREQFQRSVDDLVAELPGLERDELLVRLLRIIASTGERDGHMGLFPLVDHERDLHLAPIRAWVFPEGIYVVSSPERPDLVGARIVAIEGRPVEEVAALVRPLVTRDNEQSLVLRLPEFMITGEILHGLGLSETADQVRLTVERAGGQRLDATLRTLAGPEYWSLVQHVWAPPPPVGRPTPLWLRNQTKTQWFATLARGRVVYAVYSHATESTYAFSEALLRRARDPRVRRVIVDARLNGGGDNTSYGPLLAALRARSVNRPGRLVLLTGRVTFSAGGNFAAEVDAFTRARIVGEPAGGSPHNYGDSTLVELPTLGWTVYVPPEYVEVLGRVDERVALEPDVAVQIGAADHFAGRDPVLAKAISIR